MPNKKIFTEEEAMKIGNSLKINWNEIDLEQFRQGLHVELEHGLVDAETNVTDDDYEITGKVAWAHLKEFADYYTRLKKMEDDAEEYWKDKK